MNELSYSSVISSCIDDVITEQPLIEYRNIEEKEKWEQTLTENEILFVLNGSLFISYEKFLNREVAKNRGIVLPPGCHYTGFTPTGVSLLIFRPKDEIRFCDTFSLDILKNSPGFRYNLNQLIVNNKIEAFLHNLELCIKDGLTCNDFMELKMKELFFLLHTYYSKQLLAEAFFPLLSEHVYFSNFVLKNYLKVKTIAEFATLYSCSVTGFTKKFKKAFGKPAYQWITEKKVKLLYHEINATNKSLRQIASELGFSSLSQFNDYCKKHFGVPPGKLRNKIHE